MKRVIGVWVLSLATLSPVVVFADPPACSDLKSPWYDHYITDMHMNWDTKTFACPGGEGALALALYDLEKGEFRANSAGGRPDFYGIVKNSIKLMVYDPECKYLATGLRSEGKMTICKPFFDDSREDRASTLVHEARHLQADDPSHVDCVGGSHNGDSGACDDTFYGGTWKGSGFNADIYFYAWNLRGSTRNELSRSVMQGVVNAMIPDRFNHITAEQVKAWRAN